MDRGKLSKQTGQGFMLSKKAGVAWIAFADLVYIEVINKTVFFYLADKTVREAAASLADFEEKLLSRPEFLKTHRSYLVNLIYVQALEKNCAIMKGGHSVPVSRQRRSQVREAYEQFIHRPQTETPGGPWRILLVDDNPADCAVWADILKRHGCIVQFADNGEDALRLAEKSPYDCVLLDVMIPGEDGFSICQRFHRIMDTPIIFLSSLTEPDKQVEGFAAGGIDYITKDTSAQLFWAKVETRIRLSASERMQLSYGPLLMDLKERRAWIEGKELSLAPVEFDILCRLSERIGHIFTPEELYDMIWNGQPWDGGELVQTHMSRLRRKLNGACEHCFIETVWGQGYRFVPVDQ